MSDLLLGLILAAVVLGYASFMLYIRLGSQGVPVQRARRLLVELWATFAVITAFFAGARTLIGGVPRSDVGGEFAYQWTRLQELPVEQQILLGGTLLVAVVLFAHLLRAVRMAEAAAQATES